MPHPVVSWQILSPEPGKAAGFYQKLFAWEVSTANSLGYRELKTGGGGPDGGIWPAPPGTPGFVQLFVAVDDVDAAVANATRLGGRVLVPKSVLPDGDTMAVLQDPLGMSFGICRLGRKAG